MVSWAKEHGLEIPYNEIKNGTHNSAPWDNLPSIFNFFEKRAAQVAAIRGSHRTPRSESPVRVGILFECPNYKGR
jgi:hypothetical protein